MVAAFDLSAQIRAMTEADLAEVVQVEGRAYEFPWTFTIFKDCVRAGYGCFVLATRAEIIGYFVLSVAANEAHVLNVCVDPSEQGHGYGRRLMKRLLDLARWHRAERVFLEVRPSNPRAIALYHDLGFNEIGRRPRYYPAKNGREDALVMAIELVDPGFAP
ncbi:MAG: ribosomal protein S18-alanine N-acetyltransferase [Xanthomonadales bacterium]|nr:ribosomal protein S18-alanine N-acetyltransferase [Xanthomonadales bacterium]MBK7146743.1 ribosomal protein S18-alanine N-acetyltransferase [Xanthomonadales bacterium]MCC6560934.1 ribosomal protein S18-alanine N-acetyltransferase [Xanthomonadales bacterium]